MKDYSKVLEGRRQVVRGRSLTIGSEGFLGKSFGVAITGIMLCGFCGTVFAGWMIKSGLDELAEKKTVRLELTQMRQTLLAEKDQLLAKGNFETAARGIGLYPVSPAQVQQF